ncbi:hypothetical protein B0H15DRAFT_811129, partial [Mycena belliarum]
MAWTDWVSRGVVVEGWAAAAVYIVSRLVVVATCSLDALTRAAAPQAPTQYTFIILGRWTSRYHTPASTSTTIHTRTTTRRFHKHSTFPAAPNLIEIPNHGRPPASQTRYNLSCIAMTSCSINPPTHRSSGTPLMYRQLPTSLSKM